MIYFWLFIAMLLAVVIGACQFITVQTGEGHDTSRGVKVEATKGDVNVDKTKEKK